MSYLQASRQNNNTGCEVATSAHYQYNIKAKAPAAPLVLLPRHQYQRKCGLAFWRLRGCYV